MATKEKKKKNPFKRAYNRTNLLINPVARTKAMTKGIRSVAKKGLSTANKARKVGWDKGKKVVSDIDKQRKNVLEKGKKTLSNVTTASKKYNPASDANKKIREKEKIIKSKDSTRGEKAKAQSQKSAVIRKRDDIKIKDVHAKQKSDMQKRAEKRHAAWKAEREKKRKARKNRK
jgi:hypothetical protein